MQERHLPEDYVILCGEGNQGKLQASSLVSIWKCQRECMKIETCCNLFHHTTRITDVQCQLRKAARVEVSKRARIHERGIGDMSLSLDGPFGDEPSSAHAADAEGQ